MGSDKWEAVLKEAADYFGAATTVMLFLLSAIGAAVSIPMVVAFPLVGAVGLLCGLAGVRKALKQYRERKKEQQLKTRGMLQETEAEHNLTVITHKLQHDLREIEVNHRALLGKEVELKKDADEELEFDDRLPELSEDKYEYHMQPRFFAVQKPANSPQIRDEEKRQSALSL